MPRWPNTVSLLVVLFGMSSALCPGLSRAADDQDWFRAQLSMRLSNRVGWKKNFLNPEGHLSAGGAQDIQGLGRQVESVEEPFNLRFDKDELGYSVLAGASLGLDFGSAVRFLLSADTGEIKSPYLMTYRPVPKCGPAADYRCSVTSNGLPIGDEARQTGFVRQAALRVAAGSGDWLTIRAGKILLSTGNGFIMNNYALGGSIDADFELGFDFPLQLGLDLVLPDGRFSSAGKNSPHAMVELAYPLSFFEEIGLFFAWYRDGDDALASIMSSVLMETALNSGAQGQLLYQVLSAPDTLVRSRGNLFWIGLRANKSFLKASISATAIVEFGSFDFSVRGENPNGGRPFSATNSPACLGGMADVDFHYDVTDDLTLGAFVLFLSGESFQSDSSSGGLVERYSSFISIYPYITRTNLFFSGGMNQSFSARTFSPSGVNGRGVIASGLTAGWDLHRDVTVRMVSSALLAHGRHMSSGSRFYGWETDLNLDWRISSNVSFSFEADWLWTGPFFDFYKPLEALDQRDREFTQEPSAYRLLLGLDVYY